MKIYVTPDQMKDADKNTQEVFKMDGLVLMERAALFTVDVIKSLCDKNCCIAVLAGSGNNGGDGIAIARLLWEEGYQSAVYLCGDKAKMTKDCLRQYETATIYKVPFLDNLSELSGFGLIVDAVTGVGFKGELRKEVAEITGFANTLNAKRIAVDMPTGVSSDDGSASCDSFNADVTVTFGFEKIGQHLYPGKALCGEVVRGRIGITDRSLSPDDKYIFGIENSDLTRMIPARRPDSHKGTYGKVLIIAGSSGMAGAAYMCAASAFACGCGMVKIISVPENRNILQTLIPEAMFAEIDEYNFQDIIDENLGWADVVVAGCGLSQSSLAFSVIDYLASYCELPLVLDADGLNLFSEEHPHIASVDCVFTPHIGEMERLTGYMREEIEKNALPIAEKYASDLGVTLVLKSSSTVIFDKKGRGFINDNGCSGMATAGSGDVLSGMIGGLMAQKIPGNLAAPLAAYIHGLAGSYAASEMGESGMKASDIISGIKKVL
ncbi:MAG: NAD(P)H-hydrate dehydratase [Lachnospiraceae bacterium]|nr:NAD(P)H-hydrate dehydratase [Lachnospiraceae bacterium]